MSAIGLIVILTLLAALLLIVGYTLRTGISPMPTGSAARAAVLEALPPDPGAGVVELGAGWGGLALALARHYPRSRVIGYELSPVPWVVSEVRRWLGRLQNLALRRTDFFRADLTDAAVVVCYLCPSIMDRLRPKLEAELRPGSMVVSHFFAVRGWHPESPVVRARDRARSPVYRYRFPICLDREVRPPAPGGGDQGG